MTCAPSVFPTKGIREVAETPAPELPDGVEICRLVNIQKTPWIDWLDHGLRDGNKGALSAEYPNAFGDALDAHHWVARADDRPLAHAMCVRVRVEAPGGVLELGMIGAVYTDPGARRLGLASACVEACAADLAANGVPLAVLWSDRHAFYERMGFWPAGRETHYVLTPSICAKASEDAQERPRVTLLEASHLRALEAVYAGKPTRVHRASGDLGKLVSAPNCSVLVALRGDEPIAYAALGRGADFSGVVHEWGGEESGVLACLARFAEERKRIGWLMGPVDEAPGPALRRAGAELHPGCFALARVLDPSGLWRACVGTNDPVQLVGDAQHPVLEWPGRRIELRPRDVLRWMFGEPLDRALVAALPADSAARLAERLPWPLYVWGFDSI